MLRYVPQENQHWNGYLIFENIFVNGRSKHLGHCTASRETYLAVRVPGFFGFSF